MAAGGGQGNGTDLIDTAVLIGQDADGSDIWDERTTQVDYLCLDCQDTHELLSITDATNCTSKGIELWDLPITPGYYRRTNVSHYVRKCIVDGSCIGGTFSRAAHDTQCSEGQRGALCTVCKKGWHGGSPISGDPCVECPTDETTLMMSFIAPILGIVGGIVAIVVFIKITKRATKNMLFSFLPTQVTKRPCTVTLPVTTS